MGAQEISELARFSGGVLRDLITLARTAAEAAYREDRDRIGSADVRSAVRQLGRRYLIGLGTALRRRLQKLIDNQEFSIEDAVGKELLVNRQVLEYFSNQRYFFVVHPALLEVLADSK